MMFRGLIVVGAMLSCFACNAPGESTQGGENTPRTMTAALSQGITQQFVGVWELDPGGNYIEAADGTRTYPLSIDSQGRLIVTRDGRWLFYGQNPHRVSCANGAGQANCTSAEVFPSLWRSAVMYSAFLQIEEVATNTRESGRVFLNIDFSMWPNEVGTQGFRDYTFIGTDRLKLTRNSSLVPGSIVTLEFHRVASTGAGGRSHDDP